MMASKGWPAAMTCTVTPPSPVVVGKGKVAYWITAVPTPLPVTAKSDPWAILPGRRLAAFTTLVMVNWADALPDKSRKTNAALITRNGIKRLESLMVVGLALLSWLRNSVIAVESTI